MATTRRLSPGPSLVGVARDRLESRISAGTLIGAATLAAIALGVFVRGFHVLSSDFPLGDGGMFYAMTRDLQGAGYQLPEYTSYNGGSIPYAYPPLGFYAAALIDDLTPLGLSQVFRWIPLLATCLTVPAFALLARSMLTSRVAVVAAVLAFALIPRSFIWLLMGGGVTRALGLLFAILALYFIHRLYVRRDRSALAWSIVFSAFTVLSHLETAWFLAFSTAMFFLAFGRNRRGLADSLVLATGVAIATSVWWLQVLSLHGLETIAVVSGAGGSIFSGGEATREAYLGLLRVVSTSEPLFPLIGMLAAFGALACLAGRLYFLPLWWAAIILLDVRAFPTFTSLPVAMMAGICVSEVLLPMLRGRSAFAEPAGSRSEPLPARFWPGRALLAGLLLFAVVSAMLRSNGLGGEAPNLRSLSPDELAAMRWVSEETPSGSSFLIVPDSDWETSMTAEWFPALARRYSIATVQGSEWLNDGGLRRARQLHDSAYRCGYQATDCLTALAEQNQADFDYVYIGKGGLGQCCTTLLESLTRDPQYRLVYAGEGATIYKKRGNSEPLVLGPGE